MKEEKSFDLREEIRKLDESARRQMNVIGLYFREKNPDFRNYEQFQIGLKRNLRPAKDLAAFDDDQITKAIDRANEFVPSWTLETLLKLLTK